MSYVSGPKPALPRGVALSVLWLEEDSPAPTPQEETPPPPSGAAHDVAVARAKARVVERRKAQHRRTLTRR